jgi:hypothetical protein
MIDEATQQQVAADFREWFFYNGSRSETVIPFIVTTAGR